MKIMTPQHGCAWITGASSGIGAALAQELAGRGWQVAISARREADLKAVADTNVNIHPFACDVTDRAAMAQTVADIETALGPIALAVMNAGIYLPTALPDFDPTLFDRTFEVNLGGTVNGLAALVPQMVGRGEGHISLISSVAGYGGLVTSAAYGASKAALFNMGESLAMDLKPCGVHVSMVAPGFVKTPATDVNPFPMPFIIEADDAARRIANGLAKNQTHIAFPRRFAWMLRVFAMLPRGLYVRLAGKAMNR
ncbi:MAG: SDR family NAD(P)-dependent oxidoreductase [PS1 clade bacterium]|uniref:SDR family NAD(P)-dependent oxidoreductase n=1 Tax=PS1 clade bacterium TaxID=2175152 RepID=A0A937HEP0_9PROT|nr:SDR family NAD(P)-dependent oxidoreductase [PS1 clade bacterium]